MVPYFLRNVVELRTDGGIVGIGETHGGEDVTTGSRSSRSSCCRAAMPSATGSWRGRCKRKSMAAYAAIEMACIDACGRATGRRFCELVGGPVRDSVEFAAYLFYRYAADHPVVLEDPRLVDSRGRGDRALDSLGRGPHARGDGRDGGAVSRSVGVSGLQAQGGRAEPGRRARDHEGDGR